MVCSTCCMIHTSLISAAGLFKHYQVFVLLIVVGYLISKAFCLMIVERDEAVIYSIHFNKTCNSSSVIEA